MMAEIHWQMSQTLQRHSLRPAADTTRLKLYRRLDSTGTPGRRHEQEPSLRSGARASPCAYRYTPAAIRVPHQPPPPPRSSLSLSPVPPSCVLFLYFSLSLALHHHSSTIYLLKFQPVFLSTYSLFQSSSLRLALTPSPLVPTYLSIWTPWALALTPLALIQSSSLRPYSLLFILSARTHSPRTHMQPLFSLLSSSVA